MQWALRVARNTAPGPDGLAAAHWKALGRLGVRVLMEVAATMSGSDFIRDLEQA